METPESRDMIIKSHLDEYIARQKPLIAKILFYKHNSDLYLYYGRIRVILENENFVEETLEYGNALYVQKIIKPNEIIPLFNRLQLPRETELPVGGKRTFQVGNISFCCTGQQNYTIEAYRPQWLKQMKFSPNCRTIFTFTYPSPAIANQPLDIRENSLPYYPTFKELLLNKFGFSNVSSSHTLHFALVPLEGYISKIGIDKKNNEIFLDVENLQKKELCLKVYVESEGESCQTYDFFLNTTIQERIPAKYTRLEAILLNEKAVLLDKREFYTRILEKADTIKRIILEGENETIEFKQQLEFNKKKFAMLLTAFANTKGGKIIFGVTDEADIIGIDSKDLDEIDKFLQDISDTKFSSPVEIQKESLNLEEKLLGIFTIKKSDKIVQNKYDKRYYIRRGSTNRIMTPDEIVTFNKEYF